MMVYRMRAHEQWLNRSMEEASRLYDRAFQSTSRAIRHSHAMLVYSRLNEAYASAGAQKCHIFSQWSALCTERHVTRLWVHWVSVTQHWRKVAWREKGRHLAHETAALKVLQPKRRRSLSPDARSGKRQRRLPQSPSVVQLTGSPDRVHEDAPFIQLTGSPIRELHW